MKRLAISSVLLITGSLSVVLAIGNSSTSAQLRTLPGSVARGEQIIANQGCLNCHSLNGKGGTRGPDLAIPSRQAGTPDLFANSLWNHMPSMLAEMERSKTSAPAVQPSDAADLFAYFYATLYFSPKGDPERGREVFVDRRCSSCHSEILDTNRGTSLLDSWMDLRDPSAWAERMWNHATEMDSAMSNRGVRWPRLSERDVVDLVLFLSTRGNEREAFSFTMGEPERGKAVFESSCTTCHTMGRPERSKVDLLSRSGPSSITGYIAAMWNHAPEMRRRGGATPKLAAGEMPDLIAYLFSQRFFFQAGDSDRGRRVYMDKNCAQCHEVRRAESGAPDLTRSMDAYSPILLTSAAFRHGIPMMQMLKQQRMDWPEFEGREMADLIAYLNSRLAVRVAN